MIVPNIPVLVKVLAVFLLILGLSRLKLTLSLCLLAGSSILGLWMGMGPWDTLQSAAGSLLRPQTVGLALVVGLILVISRLMEECGHLDRIVTSFKRLTGDERTAGSAMPALIGLLPMPGGALFSAPMVDQAMHGHCVSGEQKTAINYWFRHIWEYCWPIYPGFVLAVALLEVESWQFMAVMAPMTFISVLAGVYFILRPLGRQSRREFSAVSWASIRAFVWEIMPILIVVLVITALAGVLFGLRHMGWAVDVGSPVSILVGLLVSLGWVARVNRVRRVQVKAALSPKALLPMVFLVVSIMVFKAILEDSQAVSRIRDELMGYHVPVALIVMAMPFLAGLITGIAVGFVGTSFPLIIPLFSGQSHLHYLTYAALGFSFGFMGTMLSPIHLCFLVTKDHFHASLTGSYRYIVLPVLTVLAASVCLFWLSLAL